MKSDNNVPMWFINKTTGRIGKTATVIVNRNHDGNPNLAQIVFEIPKKEQKHEFQLFFNEEEWLEEIKTMHA